MRGSGWEPFVAIGRNQAGRLKKNEWDIVVRVNVMKTRNTFFC